MPVTLTGLDDIARVVAECVALVGQHRRHFDIVQLATKGLHGGTRNALGIPLARCAGEVPERNGTASNGVADAALTLAP